jgi:hypothetical protein
MPSVNRIHNTSFVSKIHADLYFEIKKIKKIDLTHMLFLSEIYDIDVEYIYCLVKDVHNIV